MARPKKKTTTTTRTRRKAASSRSSGSSYSSIFALAAILGLGGVSIWAVSQKESPQTAISNLLSGKQQSSSTSSSASRTSRSENISQASKTKETNRDNKISAAPAPTPAVKRPPAPVTAKATLQSNNNEQQIASLAPLPRTTSIIERIIPASKPQKTEKTTPATPQSAITKLPPAGKNLSDSAPRPVFARVALRIHKNAWEKSAVQGSVKKGHEMRSYGQTGKWHRVVVPGTDVIGWVHEDQLIVAKAPVNKNTSRGISDIITGSIQPTKTMTGNAVSTPVPPASVSAKAAQ